MKASCIIPCRNEEGNLPVTIGLIKRYFPHSDQLQIVVVDHGSDDDSVRVARQAGASVVECPGVPLGHLRNLGAKSARGEVLLFLDADISVTADWGNGISDAMDRAIHRPLFLTGSFAIPPKESSWIARAWDHGLPRSGEVRRLSGGHMVISAKAFESVGGFPELLDSGEDEGLSERIWASGGKVELDPRLLVYHRGVPSGALSFFRRQYWHGLGDRGTHDRGGMSATAWLSLIFGVVSVGVLASAVTGHFSVSLLLVLLLSIGLLLLARRRCSRCGALMTILVAFIFYLYMAARFCAAATLLLDRDRRGGRRQRA